MPVNYNIVHSRIEEMKDKGAVVTIDYRLPTVAIDMPAYNYFLQGQEAEELLEEAEVLEEVSTEDAILYIASWW